jgi:hypothetical protein
VNARPITRFLESDHARLDALFAAASRGDRRAFDSFREGLLRHIGMEEKVLLPALAGNPAAPKKLVEKLRLDHGALTNLLVPEPTPEILKAIAKVLMPHNKVEEEPGGFYDACDTLLAADADAIASRMKAAPELPLRPFSKRPEALEAAKRALKRAGFDWDELVR